MSRPTWRPSLLPQAIVWQLMYTPRSDSRLWYSRCSRDSEGVAVRRSAFRKVPGATHSCRASIRTLNEPLWARCMLRSDFKPKPITAVTGLGCWGAAI